MHSANMHIYLVSPKRAGTVSQSTALCMDCIGTVCIGADRGKQSKQVKYTVEQVEPAESWI